MYFPDTDWYARITSKGKDLPKHCAIGISKIREMVFCYFASLVVLFLFHCENRRKLCIFWLLN